MVSRGMRLIGSTFLFSLPATAFAQVTDLPEIVVTSPSPIFTRTQANGLALPGQPAPGVLAVATETFAPVTLVSRDELEREAPRTLGDALADKPGIAGSAYAAGANRPVIRGLDNVRVRVQENGIGSQDASELGEDHGVPIDPLAADQIEVIRGPATLRYGSQAIGGVVSASNNRIPTFIPVNGYLGRITGSVGSVDSARDASASIDAGAGQIAFHGDAFVRRAGDYGTPRGRQANTAFSAKGGSVGASYLFDRGYFGVSLTHYESIYGIPGAESAASRTRIDMRQDKLQARGEYRPETGPFETVRLWLGASDYKHDERSLDNGIDAVGATFKNREFEGRIEAQHIPVTTGFGTLRGAVGVQFGARNLSTAGEAGGLIAPARTRTAATYLFEELELSQSLRLQAAGRVEHAVVSGTATSFPADFLPGVIDPVESDARRRFTPGSVSLGVLKTLPMQVVASLNAQYVERAPSAPELYSRGPHEATATFEIGDPNLKKEIARTIEFALRRKEGPLRFDASLYATRYTGFIYKRLTGVQCGEEFSTCGVETELQQIVYSQQNAKFYGLDLAAQYDLFELGSGMFGIDGRYDFVRARFDDGTNAPRIPPHRLGGGIFWRNQAWFARVGLLHAFSHDETAPLETRTPGYNLLKAELSYTQKLGKGPDGRSVTVSLVGDNLLNAEVRHSTSFLKDEVLMPGRTVRAAMTLRF
jgi:iron complex outermembrane receptor protein